MALTTIFLKLTIDGKPVEGEAEMRGYEGQIEVESLSWKLEPDTVKGASDERAHAAVKGKPVSLTKVYDESSGSLMLAVDKRKKFSTALFTMISNVLAGDDGKSLKVMELLLSDGFVESVDLRASEASKAISIKETVTLSYKKCEIRYFPPGPNPSTRAAAMTFMLEMPVPDGE